MFGKLKNKLGKAARKFDGRIDFLEAVCASCALVAAADGEVSDEEVKATINAIKANAVLAEGFKQKIIEQTADKMLKRAQSGRTGRLGLYKEIEDIDANEEMAEVVYLAALDIAESDGAIEGEEKNVLDKIAQRLGVNPANLEV